MTPQERTMIDELVERIRNTPIADKDGEAEAHLKQTLGTFPDALYVLTQTVLVQQYGLNQAQQQLQARQEEIDQLKRGESEAAQGGQKGGGSFLSRIFGGDEPRTPAPAPPSQTAASGGYQPVNYVPAPGGYPPPPPYGGQPYPAYGSGPGYGSGYGSPPYGAPAYGNAPGGFGGGGGFLRGAMQTAAGVAAGALVFQGVEDLFRGFDGHEGHGIGNMPGETVVNNYYDGSDRSGDHGDTHDLSGRDDPGFYNPSGDASREDDNDARGFTDVSADQDSDDGSANDFDDSFSDSDDGGGDDGGGTDSDY